MKAAIFCLVAIVLGSAFAAVPVSITRDHDIFRLSDAPSKPKYAGFTFTNDRYCPNVTYSSPKARESLDHLRSTGTEWIALVVGNYQERPNSTDIFPVHTPIYQDYYTHISATDDDVRSIVNYAHEIGFKVMLKPHIDLIDESGGYWRGDIGKGLSEDEWVEWFASYEKFLLHYTDLSAELGIEMLSVGCELITASKQEDHWRKLVPKVRQRYSGLLTVSANWWYLNGGGGEAWDKQWWDLVDLIGVDAYWSLDDCRDVESCLKAWEPIIEEMEMLVSKWEMPMILTEAGSCSGLCRRGRDPSPADFEFQAGRYEGTFEAFKDKSWMLGYFWWNWNTDPAAGGMDCDCITPQFKPAEEVLRYYYHAEFPKPPEMPAYERECICTV